MGLEYLEGTWGGISGRVGEMGFTVKHFDMGVKNRFRIDVDIYYRPVVYHKIPSSII